MAFPATSIGNQFPNPGFISDIDLHNRIDVPLDALRGALINLTAFIPTWRSSGTQPAIGNGSYVGNYTQIGNEVTGHGQVNLGSTSTIGTGNYTFDLPVAALGAYVLNTPCGWLTFVDSSAGLALTRVLLIASSTTCTAVDGSGVVVSATAPAVPTGSGTPDKYLLGLSYLSA